MAVGDPILVDLIERARFLDALDSALRDALPPQLASRCRLANVDDTRLVFLASSSLVAARLRLMQDELLRCANRNPGGRYEKLTVKVAPVPSVHSMPSSSRAVVWNSSSASSRPMWLWLRQKTQ